MTTINDLLAALPDPLAEIELWRQLAREAYERGRADGWYDGHEAAEQEMAERWDRIARPIARIDPERAHDDLEVLRWGADGREHFGDPRPGDRTPAEMVANATASWEPFGLPEPGMVHLSGKVVHWHQPCTTACNYPAGWYTIAEAITILRRLPGNYSGSIAELEYKAADLEGRRAA